jgi:YfiR/HmsC-like
MKKLIFTFFAMSLIGAAWAQEKPLHEIHSAMLYNFIKYVQWPNEGDGGEFIVGVLGEDDVFNTLKQWYDGKPKGSKKYVIKKLTSVADAATCSVIYVGKGKSNQFDEIRGSIVGKPVMTITNGNGLGQKGSCINFKVIDGKLKFEMNQSTFSTANLKVSSQLSSMAILI